MPRNSFPRTGLSPTLVADLVVVLGIVLFCLAATRGTLLLTPLGVGMDSDLQNYAQVLEATRHPAALAHDPLAHLLPRDPGVPNLLTLLADTLGGDLASVRILKAGFFALLAHLLAWYCFGRLLLERISLAVVLMLASSITCYWAFGTFWGATFEEPVPRLFYNALWPLLLLLGCRALDSGSARLVLSFVLGASMFVHSVSALMNALLFMTVFVLVRPAGMRPGRHMAHVLACLALFLAPFFCFYVLRVPSARVDPGQMDLFRQLFDLRFARDWGVVWPQLGSKLLEYCTKVPLLPLGALGLAFAWTHRARFSPLQLRMLRLVPLLLVGMLAACLVCLAEMQLAPHLGRLSMSYEVLRGTRFLLPLCLISLGLALVPLWQRLTQPLACALALLAAAALLVLSPEKQVVAARYVATSALHLEADSAARRLLATNGSELDAVQAVQRLVPAEESVFAPQDSLAVRYVARHALEPVHKDGIIIYQTRQPELARRWLAEQRALQKGPHTIPAVWQASPAPWMLVRRDRFAAIPDQAWRTGPGFAVIFANTHWLLLRKTAAGTIPTQPSAPEARDSAGRSR